MRSDLVIRETVDMLERPAAWTSAITGLNQFPAMRSGRSHWEVERYWLPEANYHDPFPVLRDAEPSRIKPRPMEVVPGLIPRVRK